MKIGVRGGHSPHCKGAVGFVDEQTEVRKISYKVMEQLRKLGHTVIDCNSDSSTVSGELNEGTNKANNNGCELYIPIHMNASNGNGHGCECWVYGVGSNKVIEIGNKINSNLSAQGYTNRGIKYSSHLHDTRCAKGQTCLIEIAFCDNKNDVDLYHKLGINKIAECIVKGIDLKSNGKVDISNAEVKPVARPVQHRILKTWEKNINGSIISSLQSELNRQFGAGIKVDGWAGDSTVSKLVTCHPHARGGITRCIQQLLLDKGYKLGKWGADGVFGNNTIIAVKQLQNNNGIAADGIVGINTWKALLRK